MSEIVLKITIVLVAGLLGGCTLFGDDFSNTEAFLAEIRNLNDQHNDLTHSLPQKVDDIKLTLLFREFSKNEQLGKNDRNLMIDIKNELQKSLQNNNYKLQYLSKLLKKTATLETKKQNLDEFFQANATDTLNALTKQYKAEQQLTSYYIEQDTNTLKYLESKIEGKTPRPYPVNSPPINPDAPSILQNKVDGEINFYEDKLDIEKDKRDHWFKYRLKDWGIIG